jgi:hypothetical protein
VWGLTGAVACQPCAAGTWSGATNAPSCTGAPCTAGPVGPAARRPAAHRVPGR